MRRLPPTFLREVRMAGGDPPPWQDQQDRREQKQRAADQMIGGPPAAMLDDILDGRHDDPHAKAEATEPHTHRGRQPRPIPPADQAGSSHHGPRRNAQTRQNPADKEKTPTPNTTPIAVVSRARYHRLIRPEAVTMVIDETPKPARTPMQR